MLSTLLKWIRLALPALLLASVSILSGCLSFGGGELPDEISAERQVIVLEALGQIGRPYRYGGTTPDGFDCSGLTQYVYAQAGVRIPRTTSEQYESGKHVSLKKAQPGDLLFYRFNSGGRVDHVAVYLGNGEALHAPASRRQVIVAGVDDPTWTKRFVTVVRVIP